MRRSAAAVVISVTLGVATTNHFLKLKSPQMENAAEEELRCEAAAALHNDEECTKPIFENGRYRNPWEDWVQPVLGTYLKMLLTTKNETSMPSREELDEKLPVVKPDLEQFTQPLHSGVRLMWVGHATVVVQLDGFTFITDPVFSQRIGTLVGPKRYRDAPCTIEDLPKLDAVLISHDHHDHLDYPSVVALNKRFGKDLRWFVPVGLKSWMNDSGCENVVELSWWEEVEGSGGVRVACTPCAHWCRRGVFDQNKVLWSSWCVLGPNHSFHFAGDTGYCRGFQQIGRKYGPFTAAAIPIGAYYPRWFMKAHHVDPEHAVDIHLDIKSRHSVGVHWGTFVLSKERYLEPRELLEAEVRKRKLSPSAFITVDHGAVTTFGADGFEKID